MARPRKLTPAQERYVFRAEALRKKLTNGALAERFGVQAQTISLLLNNYRSSNRRNLRKKFRRAGVDPNGICAKDLAA